MAKGEDPYATHIDLICHVSTRTKVTKTTMRFYEKTREMYFQQSVIYGSNGDTSQNNPKIFSISDVFAGNERHLTLTNTDEAFHVQGSQHLEGFDDKSFELEATKVTPGYVFIDKLLVNGEDFTESVSDCSLQQY